MLLASLAESAKRSRGNLVTREKPTKVPPTMEQKEKGRWKGHQSLLKTELKSATFLDHLPVHAVCHPA